MVACLVRAGLFPTWREAFDSVRKFRKGVKLNGKMRTALDEWEASYCTPYSEPPLEALAPELLRRSASSSPSSQS